MQTHGQRSENSRRLSQIFWQHEILSLRRFGHFPARKVAAGKIGPASSETATAFLSTSWAKKESLRICLRGSHSATHMKERQREE